MPAISSGLCGVPMDIMNLAITYAIQSFDRYMTTLTPDRQNVGHIKFVDIDRQTTMLLIDGLIAHLALDLLSECAGPGSARPAEDTQTVRKIAPGHVRPAAAASIPQHCSNQLAAPWAPARARRVPLIAQPTAPARAAVRAAEAMTSTPPWPQNTLSRAKPQTTTDRPQPTDSKISTAFARH